MKNFKKWREKGHVYLSSEKSQLKFIGHKERKDGLEISTLREHIKSKGNKGKQCITDLYKELG